MLSVACLNYLLFVCDIINVEVDYCTLCLIACTMHVLSFILVCDLKLIDITGCLSLRILIMVISSTRRCLNEPNVFYYVCGEYTFQHNRKAISDFIKRAYLAYFK